MVLNAGEQLKKASAAGAAEERPGPTPLSLLPPLPFQKSLLLRMLSSCSGEWGAWFPLQHLPSRVRAGGFPIQDQPLAGWLESQDPTHSTPSFWTESSGSQSQVLGRLRQAEALLGLEMVRAELESYISSVNQHLGDYDPRGPVSSLLAHPHGGHRGDLLLAPGGGSWARTRLLDFDRSRGRTLGVGWPGPPS